MGDMGHQRPPGSARRRPPFPWVTLATVVLAAVGAVHLGATQPPDASPEARAIGFLAGEVPRWPAENDCYSCHNNGDAARALYTAQGLGYAVEPGALRDTTTWLQNPAAWDDNALGLEFADTTLARIQFAGALVDAMVAGRSRIRIRSRRPPLWSRATSPPTGPGRLDASGSIGSPATYGTALATWAALRVLTRVGTPDLSAAVARAGAWVRGVQVQTVIDAAAVVLALGVADDAAAVAQRQRGLELIREGRAPSGGWGAYVTSAVESFDTALVVLALQPLLERPDLAAPAIDTGALTAAVADGRAYLLNEQLRDGSWGRDGRDLPDSRATPSTSPPPGGPPSRCSPRGERASSPRSDVWSRTWSSRVAASTALLRETRR